MEDSGDCQDTASEASVELVPRGDRSDSVVSDGSEDGGRDSGIEAEKEPDMVIPDEDLMAKIVAQVEFYFSDANVAKDKFLLKHIRRNNEGYVSLKLVSSFKKVKQLTKDWRVVAYSLNKKSSKIQINDVGTKIRRVDPLPEIQDVPDTCAVLALSIQSEKLTMGIVSDIFAECGEIALLKLSKSGTPLSQELKSLSNKYPELNTSHCAWIEFDTCEAAKAALDLSSDAGMKVVPLLPEKKKEEKVQPTKNNSRKNSLQTQISQNNSHNKPPSRKNSIINPANLKGQRKASNGFGNGFSNGFEPHNPLLRQPRRKCLSLPQTQSPNLKELTNAIEARKNRPKSKSCTEFPSGGSGSWVHRHLLSAAAAAASSPSPRPGARPDRVSQGSLTLPEGVLRFPKGPDGSKGFASRRVSVTVAAQ